MRMSKKMKSKEINQGKLTDYFTHLWIKEIALTIENKRSR